MTREEALDWLCRLRSKIYVYMPKEWQIPMNNALDMAIKTLEQQSCEDTISRESLRQKLQEHHDFFVNAYGGFSNLPRNDKSRVDEISNCIAMVVNEPSIQPKTGRWINDGDTIGCYYCSECGGYIASYDDAYCKYCGAKMVEEQEGGDEE